MPPFASEQFHAITREASMCLGRAQRYRRPLDYLHRMTVDANWQPGGKVTMVSLR
jgi:hypothetical protein